MAVTSFTFQAPGFYQRHGYVETGRTLGIPGGNADVHLFKSFTAPADREQRSATADPRPRGARR